MILWATERFLLCTQDLVRLLDWPTVLAPPNTLTTCFCNLLHGTNRKLQSSRAIFCSSLSRSRCSRRSETHRFLVRGDLSPRVAIYGFMLVMQLLILALAASAGFIRGRSMPQIALSFEAAESFQRRALLGMQGLHSPHLKLMSSLASSYQYSVSQL